MRTHFILIISFVLFFSADSTAQVITKSQKLLIGSANLGWNHNQNDTAFIQNSFFAGLSPGLGKAIKDNLVFGYMFSPSYNYSKTENKVTKSEDKTNGYFIGGGIFLRKYFPLGKNFSFLGTLSAKISYQHTKLTITNMLTSSEAATITKGLETNLQGSVGLNYAINKKWLIDFSLNNFANLYLRHQNVETKSGSNSIRQKFTQSGFNSEINSGNPLSYISFGFSHLF